MSGTFLFTLKEEICLQTTKESFRGLQTLRKKSTLNLNLCAEVSAYEQKRKNLKLAEYYRSCYQRNFTRIKIMATPKHLERCRKAQTYDKDNIFVTIRGEKVNVYDMIQEARKDTEIAQVLNDYGCIEKLGIDTKKTYDSLMQINDLRDIYEAKEKADKLWEQLPIEVRQEFNNNAHEFMKNGEQWLKAKIEAEKTNETPDLSQATGATTENKGE